MKHFLTNSNDWGFSLFDRAMEDFFTPMWANRQSVMRTDVKETEKDFNLLIDMPGFEKSDINLTLKNGYLTVQAQKQEKEEDESYIKRERSYSCQRSFYVGENVTEEDIKAKYQNGTLSLTVPKVEKKELPTKHIQID